MTKPSSTEASVRYQFLPQADTSSSAKSLKALHLMSCIKHKLWISVFQRREGQRSVFLAFATETQFFVTIKWSANSSVHWRLPSEKALFIFSHMIWGPPAKSTMAREWSMVAIGCSAEACPGNHNQDRSQYNETDSKHFLAIEPSYVIAIDSLNTPFNSSIKLLQVWVIGQVRWKVYHPSYVIRMEAFVHVSHSLVVN